MKNRIKISCILLLMLSNYLIAQDFEENIIPPSPEIASLGKYLDFPISYYTGQANITIPIHTLKVGDIKLPINLSYHTGGIRVADVSSWTGMGWSINYGGFISRTINGQPDGEREIFFPDFPFQVNNITEQNNFKKVAQGIYDSQHDIYNFSAGGYSGKFVVELDHGGRVIQIPKQNLKIEHTGFVGINYNDFFNITTPNGITHYFDQLEKTTSKNYCTGSGSGSTKTNKSSWRPSKMVSASTNQFIDFSYVSETISHDNPPVFKEYHSYVGSAPPHSNEICTSSVTYEGQKRISQIKGSDGTQVKFIPGPERKDLPGSRLLSKIEIYFDGKLIKEFVLNYKYLVNKTLYDINDNSISFNNEKNRLVLLSVQERINGNSKPAYQFEYNLDKGLPERFSKSIDYWGYYNGIHNQTLIPSLRFGSKFYSGAKRKPVLANAKQGTIKKITYPTGGYTTYDYELNECTNTVFKYYDSEQQFFETYKLDMGSPSNELDFTLNATQSNVDLTIEFTEDNVCTNFSCKVELGLYKLNTISNQYEAIISMSQTEIRNQFIQNSLFETILSLEPGKYKLIKTINDPTFQDDDYYIQIKWFDSSVDPEPELDYQASGLRVSKIDTYDPLSNDIITKKIKYESGALVLSGFPKFIRGKTFCASDSENTCLERSSSPNYSLSTTNGGIVGYGKVTVTEGVNMDNGKTEYNYITYRNQPDYLIDDFYSLDVGSSPNDWGYFINPFGHYTDFSSGDYEFPYPLIDSKDWKRGLLTQKAIYDNEGELIEKTERKYRFFDDPTDTENYDPSKVYFVEGISLNPEKYSTCISQIFLYRYQLASTWYEMEEEITTLYTSSGSFTNSTKYDEYNTNHLLPTKITTSTSIDSELRIQEILYPQDFTDNQFGSDILRSNHILNIPLTSTIFDQESTPLSKKETYYGLSPHLGSIMPNKQANYPKGTSTNPIIVDFKFDEAGKILDATSPDNRNNTSYRWGYNNSLPIIKIENPQIGFDNSYQNVDVLPQGYNSLEDLVSNLDDIATNPLKKTLWRTYNTNLREHASNKDAMIYTYTYKPLVGITSITDPRGYTMYYQYDDLNRLEFVKDADGNLVSENKYNYKN